MKLEIVTFSDKGLDENNRLLQDCNRFNIPLHNASEDEFWTRNAQKIRHLYDFLRTKDRASIVLVMDAFDTCLFGDASEILAKYKKLDADIIFSAEANFYLRHQPLKYYYWKFYPRANTPYHYLNSGSFIGKASSLLQLLEEIKSNYDLTFGKDELDLIRSDQYLYHRFYVDNYYDPSTKLKVGLDTTQELFGCTGGRMCAGNVQFDHWIQDFLFARIERTLLKALNLQHHQVISRDYRSKDGRLINTLTHTMPSIFHIPGSGNQFQAMLGSISDKAYAKPFWLARFVSVLAYWLSKLLSLVTKKINGGLVNPKDIFRFSENKATGFPEVKNKLLKLLFEKRPFAFAHFNDGEMTFIQQYLAGHQKEFWFGRGQNQYSFHLGEKLLESFRSHNHNYFVGIPCAVDHPGLHELALQNQNPSGNYIPAMSIHHNQTLIPSILLNMRARECYFVVNNSQNLDFYEHFGIKVKHDNIIYVPFKNAHLKFDELQDQKFPKGSIVILTCGMLSKIIVSKWYQNNPEATFITIGSAMDDFIQKRWNFKLFPPRYPFSHNYLAHQYFLFGNKKHCEGCYIP